MDNLSLKDIITENILFFPIRHHSPACSYHLKNIIESFNPKAILIEGPSDCNNLFEFMIDKETKAPFCIYCDYDKDTKYRSYYPFLDYSPELVAIKESFIKNIHCEFIDMPFASMIENSNTNYNKINALYDKENIRFNLNEYTLAITKKSGLRTFQELWEREFEINGILKTSEDFINSVYTLGYYMRLIEDEDIETKNREYFMAGKIKESLNKYNKILVVTGSFHILGIAEKLKENNIENELKKIKKYNKKNSSSYLIPYSFEDSDQRNGYQAGIEFPAFYDYIFHNLKENKLNSYKEAVMHFIIKASNIDRNYHNISIADCINAYYMAENLAKLRGKNTAGVYELIDAAKSAFIKGDISLENKSNIELMMKLLSGIKNGNVSSKAILPPVIIDFRNLCKKFKIKLNNSDEIESVLDIIKDDNHFQKSKFFHKILFLDIGFCTLIKAPDYINKINKNLAREIWRYKYKSSVEYLLIDKSIYGISIDEVCNNIIKERLNNNLNSEEISKLIIECYVMGIYDFLTCNYSKIETIILEDSNFISLCQCFNNLYFLINLISMNIKEYKSLDIQNTLENLLNITFTSVVYNMDYLKDLKEEDAVKYSKYIKNIYSFIVMINNNDLKEIFCNKIDFMLSNSFGSSHIYAVFLALKYKIKKITIEEFSDIISNFLYSSQAESIAYFLSGIFLISKDILFTNDNIIKKIDITISKLDEDTFLKILPNLRYAFTALYPNEIERISDLIIDIYKLKRKEKNISSSEDIDIDKIISQHINKYDIFKKQTL